MALERKIFPSEEPIDPVIKTNLDVVASHFRDEATNNIAGVVDSYTDDIEWKVPMRGIVVKGKDAAAANYFSIFDPLKNIGFDTGLRLATRDYVFDYSTVRFTVAKEHFSHIPIGQEGELKLLHIFKMRDGKICEEVVYEMPPDTVFEQILNLSQDHPHSLNVKT